MKNRSGVEEKRRSGEKTSPEDSASENSNSNSNTETKKAASARLLLFSLSLLHLAIALPLAYFLNIWADEASTLYTTENGLRQTFQNVFADEKQAPLYFLFLSVWREINHSIFWARLPSIVFSLLAIRFFYDLARKFFDARAAGFIAAVFALHPFLIWASLEIRVYSLVVLLSVLLFKFFTEGYLEDGENAATRRRFFFVPTAIAALYANYYLGFLLVGFFAALLVLRKRREAGQFFRQMLFVGLTILPLVWEIKQQLAVNTGGFQPAKSVTEGLQLLWNHFLTFVFPTEIFSPDEQTRLSFLRVWLVRFAIAAVAFLGARHFFKIRQIVRRRDKPDADGAISFSIIDLDVKIPLFGAIAAAVGLALLAAYFLLGAKFVELRHATVLFVPCVLFVFTVLKAVLPRRAALGFALVFVFLFSYSIYTLYPNLTKRGDWARVGAFLERNEKPNQPVVVFTAFDALALPYHYKGENKILPDEKFFDWEFEAEAGSEASWRGQTEFIISEIPPGAEEIWLLTNEKCAVKDACRPLENFVRENYTITVEKDFYKEKVRLLRKKQK
jgi:hypothetical protein